MFVVMRWWMNSLVLCHRFTTILIHFVCMTNEGHPCQTGYVYSLLMRANKFESRITGLSGPTTNWTFFSCIYHQSFINIQLSKAHEELNKRIFEHDKNMATGAVKADITLAVSATHCNTLYTMYIATGTVVYFSWGVMLICNFYILYA